MAQSDELRNRIYNYALSIIKFVQTLPNTVVGYELGKQLIKAGTSVAANFEEATGAFSKDDFIYKLSLSFKEAKESNL